VIILQLKEEFSPPTPIVVHPGGYEDYPAAPPYPGTNNYYLDCATAATTPYPLPNGYYGDERGTYVPPEYEQTRSYPLLENNCGQEYYHPHGNHHGHILYPHSDNHTLIQSPYSGGNNNNNAPPYGPLGTGEGAGGIHSNGSSSGHLSDDSSASSGCCTPLGAALPLETRGVPPPEGGSLNDNSSVGYVGYTSVIVEPHHRPISEFDYVNCS